MKSFQIYAANFEFYPQSGEAFDHLFPLLNGLERVDYNLQAKNPSANSGQLSSSFDYAMQEAFFKQGSKPLPLNLEANIPQKLDFAFVFNEKSVAVEIEKTNREKILRDILKCHMYLHAGAGYAIVGLPKNYAHKHGVWDLFNFGRQRLSECRKYGFGTTEKLDRILLLGFEQFVAATDQPLCKKTRSTMLK